MNIARIVLIVAALLIAGLTAYLARSYLAQRESQLADRSAEQESAKVPAVEVLVASRDLPTGTIINPEHLRWQNWPDEAVNEAYIVRDKRPDAVTELTGTAVTRPMSAGDPVTEAKLVKPDEATFLSAVLRPGKRAYPLRVRPFEQVAGFVLPGSFVDVVLIQTIGSGREGEREDGGGRAGVVAETILREVRVIAVDQTVNDLDRQASLSDTVTLEVSPNQVEILAVASQMGQVSLSLRSLVEDQNAPPPPPYTPDSVVSTFLNSGLDARPRIVVAAADLPAGRLIRDIDLELEPLEPGSSKRGLIVPGRQGLTRFRGAYLKRPIKRGEPFFEDMIIQIGEKGFLQAALKPGMRAVAVQVGQVTGVAGFISAGDYVDVIMTHEVRDTSLRPLLTPRQYAETILFNVRLLAIEQVNEGTEEEPIIGRSATLEVTQRQAEIVALGARMGQLSLAMRSVPALDAQNPDKEPFTSDLYISKALTDTLVFGTSRAPQLIERRGGDTPPREIRVYRAGVPSTVITIP